MKNNRLETTQLSHHVWGSAIPEEILAALFEGGLLLIIGLAGLALRLPLLFASLGPTAYEQTEMPHSKSSRPYNIVVGHFVGLGAGFLGIALVHAWGSPPVLASGQLSFERVWASVIAASITTFATLLLRAGQPAALATTLLVASGAFQTLHDASVVAIGVVLLAAVGEPVRRLRLSQKHLFGQRDDPTRDS